MSLRAERMSLRIKLAGLRVDRARLLSDQRLAGGEIGGDREGIVVAHVAQHSERGAKRKSNPGKIPNGCQWRLRSRPVWQGRPAEFASGGWQSDRPCGAGRGGRWRM